MNLAVNIIKEFQSYKNEGLAGEESSLTKLRMEAFEEFQQLGIPTTKNEEWKYTSLKNIAQKEFPVSVPSKSSDVFYKSIPLKNIESNRLVFVNGIFSDKLSVIIEKDSSIIIRNLFSARKDHPVIFEKHFGKYAKTEGLALNAMNTALVNDGAFIHVPKGKTVEHPVLILNITDSSVSNILCQPRNLTVVEESASVKLIEAYYATGTNASFTNVVSEIYLNENSNLEHYKIQQQAGESYQNNFTQVFQEANTNINHVTLTLDGTMVRNNLHFFMNGENGNSLLYGLYVADKKNHIDNHTRVDHAKPNCFSNELYKGILTGKSTGVFNGKILVHKDAQKTNAYQRNQNILLSDEAIINTKPQLEIFADDVKCTHGATVGPLDEEPMFYLRSRGIPENEARKMLLNAFADAIAEEIKIPELIRILEDEIDKKL
ncbi:MAG: Fe-S cluster assembly protein SufD [Bacteroidia bacterium]